MFARSASTGLPWMFGPTALFIHCVTVPGQPYLQDIGIKAVRRLRLVDQAGDANTAVRVGKETLFGERRVCDHVVVAGHDPTMAVMLRRAHLSQKAADKAGRTAGCEHNVAFPRVRVARVPVPGDDLVLTVLLAYLTREAVWDGSPPGCPGRRDRPPWAPRTNVCTCFAES